MSAPMRQRFRISPPRMLPGPYIVPAYRVVGHVRLTNKTPAGTYRAPGRYEATFVRERAFDGLAQHLGLDPSRSATDQSDPCFGDALSAGNHGARHRL